MEATAKMFIPDEEILRLSAYPIVFTRPFSERPFELYESRMSLLREQFLNGSALFRRLMDPNIDPKMLELFLIFYNALGVPIRLPVEGWLRRTGKRCEEMGLRHLGSAFRYQAIQKTGCYSTMFESARCLIKHWNSRNGLQLSADELFFLPVMKGAQEYINLQEEIIGGIAPFSFLAAEYEIEKLSADFGPKLLDNCRMLLDKEVLDASIFIRERAALDVSRAKFSKMQIELLLSERPEFAFALVGAGEAALYAFDSFIAGCLKIAESHIKRA